MATSGSHQRKEREPESVQFWLAIAAMSLAFHSIFMFGVTRLATVTVVEPAGGGAIDVEIVDPLGRDARSEGEPIVPAAALKSDKPEPAAKPEPTPLPEFTPEPAPQASQKPEPKPEPIVQPEVKKKPEVKEVKEQKKPSVPKPDKPKGDKPKKKDDQPAKSKDPITEAPDKRGTGIKGIRFGAIGTPQLTPFAKTQNILDGTMGLPSITNFAVDPSFPLRPGQVVNLKLTLVIENATGRVVLEPGETLSPTEGDWAVGLNLTENQQIVVLETIKNGLLSIKFPPPKITVAGAGNVGGATPPETSEWFINLQFTGQ